MGKKNKKRYAKKSFKPGTVKCNTQIKQQQFHSARQIMWCYTNLSVLCHLSMLHFYHLLCLTADPEIHSVCKFFLKNLQLWKYSDAYTSTHFSRSIRTMEHYHALNKVSIVKKLVQIKEQNVISKPHCTYELQKTLANI